jgi:hypothetical protein
LAESMRKTSGPVRAPERPLRRHGVARPLARLRPRVVADVVNAMLGEIAAARRRLPREHRRAAGPLDGAEKRAQPVLGGYRRPARPRTRR